MRNKSSIAPILLLCGIIVFGAFWLIFGSTNPEDQSFVRKLGEMINAD